MKRISTLSLFFSTLLVSNLPAAITATNGTAVVDGNYNEWNTSFTGPDFAAHMYEAGNPTKDRLSNLYLRYNCSAHTLFSLILVEENHIADLSKSDAWLKIYDFSQSTLVDGNSGNDGIPPDFAWIQNITGKFIGYEASIILDPVTFPKTYSMFEAHLSVDGGDTSSTGKKKQGYQELTIDCHPTVPLPSAFLLAGLGSGIVGYMRRRRNL